MVWYMLSSQNHISRGALSHVIEAFGASTSSTPRIDMIDSSSLSYYGSGGGSVSVGGFTWCLLLLPLLLPPPSPPPCPSSLSYYGSGGWSISVGGFTWSLPCHVTFRHNASRHKRSCHVMWRNVSSCHVTSQAIPRSGHFTWESLPAAAAASRRPTDPAKTVRCYSLLQFGGYG